VSDIIYNRSRGGEKGMGKRRENIVVSSEIRAKKKKNKNGSKGLGENKS
jgi:hypothetical protein